MRKNLLYVVTNISVLGLVALLLMVLGAVSNLLEPAYAHPGVDNVRYVAEGGKDEGACQDPARPCATIEYAIRHANKGDQVRVATGSYFVESAQVDMLLNVVITVAGGFSTEDGFSVQNPEQNPTYIMGPLHTVRQDLESRGMRLIQDAKGWPTERATRRHASDQVQRQAGAIDCTNGQAGVYPCHEVDFLSQITLAEFSSNPIDANDVWGFVDLNDNREYAIIGLSNGTAVVDVTDPVTPTEVGLIPGFSTTWRDIKVYQFYDAAGRWKAYAYVTADKTNQGLQIIDLTGLPHSVSLANTYSNFLQAHNVYLSHVDYTTGVTLTGSTPYAFIAGANRSSGAVRMLDLSNPTVPVATSGSPFPGFQYSHDITSFVITDSRTTDCDNHNPCEILIDFNESTVDIWDVTDKADPFRISSTSYPNARYTHSGWWTADKRYIFIQDEFDELRLGLNTTLRTMDLDDLTKPVISQVWTGSTGAIDHNGFTKGDRYYMSNYQRGLTILDITDPNDPQEIGYFDTYPAADASAFNGAWGVYPYLPSGTILISDIEGGLFLVKEVSPPPVDPPPVDPPPGSGTFDPPGTVLVPRVYLPLLMK